MQKTVSNINKNDYRWKNLNFVSKFRQNCFPSKVALDQAELANMGVMGGDPAPPTPPTPICMHFLTSK